jgi:hypothetical protein
LAFRGEPRLEVGERSFRLSLFVSSVRLGKASGFPFWLPLNARSASESHFPFVFFSGRDVGVLGASGSPSPRLAWARTEVVLLLASSPFVLFSVGDQPADARFLVDRGTEFFGPRDRRPPRYSLVPDLPFLSLKIRAFFEVFFGA